MLRLETGSVLVLVPAAVLILAVLAAIVIDAGSAFLGQRELAQAAQTAAEDATNQLATGSFYGSGTVSVDPETATQVADASVAAQVLSGITLDGPAQVSVSGAQVCVALAGRVPVVFGGALPGVGRWIQIHAHSTATAATTAPPAGAGNIGRSSTAQIRC
ncbi:MAG: hypothetical protein ACRDWV_08060 [Acidimicrobiales bacterium]